MKKAEEEMKELLATRRDLMKKADEDRKELLANAASDKRDLMKKVDKDRKEFLNNAVIDKQELKLFYPTRRENRQTHDICCRLAVEIATTILVELRDTEKATHKYLSSAKGVYTQGKITKADRTACMNMMAHNSISESNHASSTAGLKVGGTIRLDHSCGEGQTRANNDFGRGHLAYVSGKRKKSKEKVEIELGTFHSLPQELKDSLIHVARVNASKHARILMMHWRGNELLDAGKKKLQWRRN